MEKARAELTRLPERLVPEGTEHAITVTRRGKPVLVVLSWSLHEALMETLEIVADEEQMAKLREAIQQVASGKTRPWEEIKAGSEL